MNALTDYVSFGWLSVTSHFKNHSNKEATNKFISNNLKVCEAPADYESLKLRHAFSL